MIISATVHRYLSAALHQYPSVPISAAVLSNAHHNAYQWARLQRATAAAYAQVSMHMGLFQQVAPHGYNAALRMHNAECRVQSAEYRVQRMQNA
jgi:hypothetical protein